MKRRDFLISGGILGAAIGSGYLLNAGLTTLSQASTQTLTLQRARFRLRDQVTENLVSLSPDAPPPVLRGKQGQTMSLNVVNTLDEYTAMHWHGIRLKNSMDGVPYLTQTPIPDGGSFLYQFSLPDAGTYWYHPHCMTMSQMANGLTGMLIVDEINDPGFNSDHAINLRDFHLNDDDTLRKPYSLGGAARAGTLGNVMTANWLQAPAYDHDSGSLVRLRLANSDTTRIYKLFLSHHEAQIMAWDGHPIDQAIDLPTKENPLLLGPGQRVDIALKMPSLEGQSVDIINLAGSRQKRLASLRAIGQDQKRSLVELKPLPRNPLPEPDLGTAQQHEFVFGWSPDGKAPNNGFCGSMGATFWSINRTPWPGDDAINTGPLAVLERGQSYILRFRNESPNIHPIHLHGLVFKPLRSNKRKIAANWTDTALLLKNETIDVALVADNPGDWAFHCHVIEHQKTGLAGFIRVT